MLNINSPKEIKNFIGSEKIIKKLDDFLISKEIPQSLIFYGNKGVGKANAAYLFAKKLLSIGVENIKKSSEIDLFGNIPTQIDQNIIEINPITASKIEKNQHPDLLIIELNEDLDKKSIPIDKVREIEHFVSHSPAEAKYKLVIIDSVDDLNINSSNAILKITEEPNSNSILILISHNINSLLPTIRSRCFELFFKNPNEKEFLEIIKNYNVEYNKEIAEYAGFSPGVYLNMLKYDTEIIMKFAKKFPDVDSSDITNITSIFKDDKKDKNKRDSNYNSFKNILLFELYEKAKHTKNSKQIDDFYNVVNIFNINEKRNMDIIHTIKEIKYQLSK